MLKIINEKGFGKMKEGCSWSVVVCWCQSKDQASHVRTQLARPEPLKKGVNSRGLRSPASSSEKV